MSDSTQLSRRALLGGLATTGTALVGCGGDDAPTGPDADVSILNGLLSAEFNAIAAYDAGLTVIANAPTSDPQVENRSALTVIAMRWKDQHETHATQLSVKIRALRGTPGTRPTTAFQPPPNFTGTITNVLRLACNAERAAAIAYNGTIAALKNGDSRGLAGSIEGDETQHFIVLYALLKGLVAPVPAVLLVDNNVNNIVPQPFVTAYGGNNGLLAVTDFTF